RLDREDRVIPAVYERISQRTTVRIERGRAEQLDLRGGGERALGERSRLPAERLVVGEVVLEAPHFRGVDAENPDDLGILVVPTDEYAVSVFDRDGGGVHLESLALRAGLRLGRRPLALRLSARGLGRRGLAQCQRNEGQAGDDADDVADANGHSVLRALARPVNRVASPQKHSSLRHSGGDSVQLRDLIKASPSR